MCTAPVLETDTCLGSGYAEGSCCDTQVSNCTSIDESCYCDAACYENNDCCEDIEESGCFRKYNINLSQLSIVTYPFSIVSVQPQCWKQTHVLEVVMKKALAVISKYQTVPPLMNLATVMLLAMQMMTAVRTLKNWDACVS